MSLRDILNNPDLVFDGHGPLALHQNRLTISECIMDPEVDKGLQEVGKLMARKYTAQSIEERVRTHGDYRGGACGEFRVSFETVPPKDFHVGHTNRLPFSICVNLTFDACGEANCEFTFRRLDDRTFSIDGISLRPHDSRSGKMQAATFFQGIDAFMQEYVNITGKVSTIRDDDPAQFTPEYEQAGYTPVPDEASELSSSTELATRAPSFRRPLQKQFFPQLGDTRESVARIIVDIEKD